MIQMVEHMLCMYIKSWVYSPTLEDTSQNGLKYPPNKKNYHKIILINTYLKLELEITWGCSQLYTQELLLVVFQET